MRIVNALYPDDFGLEEVMARDDVDALRRLVPFMRSSELDAYVDRGIVVSADDFEGLAKRARGLGLPAAWANAISRVATETGVLEGLAVKGRALASEDAAFVLRPTLTALEPIVSAPAIWLDDAVEVVSWDPSVRLLTVTHVPPEEEEAGDEEDDEATKWEKIELLVPEQLAESAAAHPPGSSVRVLASADDEGDWWSVYSIAGADGELVSIERIPPRIGEDVSAAAMSVVAVLAEAGHADAASLVPVLSWAYPRSTDWASGLRIFALAVRRDGADTTVVEQAVHRLRITWCGIHYLDERVSAEVSGATLDVLGGLARSAETSQAPDIARLMADLVPAADPAARDRVAADLREARREFDRRPVFEAVSSVLPESRLERVQVICSVLEPVDRVRALSYYLDDMRVLEEELAEATEESQVAVVTDTLHFYLDRVEIVAAQRRTKRGQQLLLKIPFVAIPTYAARVTSLIERCELDARPSTPFLEAAAASSGQALADVCTLLMRTGRTGVDELNAVLAGIGRGALRREALPRAADAYQRSLQSRVPRLEQHARIASLLDWQAAERVAGGALLVSIFSSAVPLLKSDPAAAARRLSVAEAWVGSSPTRRRQAAEGYCALLDAVRRDEQLGLVVGSALSFFDSRPVDKQKTRQAAWDAIARVYRRGQPSEKTLELLERAMNELEWEGTPSRGAPRHVRKILGH